MICSEWFKWSVLVLLYFRGLHPDRNQILQSKLMTFNNVRTYELVTGQCNYCLMVHAP